MLSTVSYIFGQIKAEQTLKRIVIGGFKTYPLLKEIQKLFSTTRISAGMFYVTTGTRIEIPLFFAYDFLELIRLVRDNPSKFYNPKIINSIEEELLKLPVFQRTLAPVTSKLNRKQLDKFTVKPLGNQEEFFKAYDSNTQRFGLKGYILASPPGTGKTLSSLFLGEMLQKKIHIIFSPSNALERVWEDTFKQFYHNTPNYFIYGKTKHLGNETYYVFSHENMKFAKEFITTHLKGKDCSITIDECQAFTEMKSERTQILIELCNFLNCKEVLFMSGTPFKALGAEVIPYLWCADPYFDKHAEERFKKVFGVSGTRALGILSARIGRSMYKIDKAEVVNNTKYHIDLKVTIPHGNRYTMSAIRDKMEKFVKERVEYYKIHGPRMVDEYNRIIQLYENSLTDNNSKLKLAVYKKEALRIRNTNDLRSVQDEIMRCNTFERKEIIPNLPAGVKDKFRDTRAVYKYVSLKIQGEALGRILGNERKECNLDILRHLDNAKIYCPELELNGEPWSIADIFETAQAKTIFFTDYVEVVSEAGKLFETIGMKPALVYADTNKDLNNIIKQVDNDPKVNPIVATYKSLSTAVPLTMCSTAVLLNVPYRDYIYNQATSRIDRLGQKNTLMFYHVYLDTGEESNISTRSKDIMVWSRELVEQLMNYTLTDDPEVIEESFVDNFLDNPTETIVKKLGYSKW